MLEAINNLLSDYDKIFSGAAQIATILSLLLTSIALGFTALQVKRNNQQLRAKTIYEIQRDGRKTARTLLSNKDLAGQIIGKHISQQQLIFAEVGQLFNFYAAVYQQRCLDILDAQLWSPFEAEIYTLLSSEVAKEFWQKKKTTGQYDPQFICLINNLLSTSSRNTNEHNK